MTGYDEAAAILQRALLRYHQDPVLHWRACMAAEVVEEMTGKITTSEGEILSMSGASRDDLLTAAAVALVVAEMPLPGAT